MGTGVGVGEGAGEGAGAGVGEGTGEGAGAGAASAAGPTDGPKKPTIPRSTVEMIRTVRSRNRRGNSLLLWAGETARSVPFGSTDAQVRRADVFLSSG